MNLPIVLALSLFPFVGALLMLWMGPRHSWSAHYRRARERTAAAEAEADRMRVQLEEADARLQASQERMRGGPA